MCPANGAEYQTTGSRKSKKEVEEDRVNKVMNDMIEEQINEENETMV
jgi:hypothetical protein